MLLSPYPREITANARFDNLLPGTQLLSLVSLPVLLTSLVRSRVTQETQENLS